MEVLLITSFFLLLILPLLVMNTKSYISSRASNKKLPPGPKPLPIIGNLLDLGDRPHKSLANLSKTYGPIMSLKLGQVTAIVVSSSTVAKEALQTFDQFFCNRPIPDAAQAFNHGRFGMPWIPASALWRTLRKISNSHLFSGKVLDANMNLRHTKLQDLLHELKKSGQTDEAVDIGKAALTTTLNLLSTTIFSIDLATSASNNNNNNNNNKDNFAREIKETIWGLMEEVGKTNVADYFPLLKKLDPQGIRRRATIHMKKFMDLFDVIINKKLQLRAINDSNSSKCNDVLDSLIDAMIIHEKNKEDGQLDRNAVQHLLLDLITAGTETTSSTLEWSMAELLQNPNILSKAQEELNRVIGKGNQVKESDVTQLPYLQSIVKETLRLHPPLPFVPRQAESDVELCGFTVPKGSKLLVNVWAIGRDPSVWENPDKFIPERFRGSDSIDVRAKNFEFVPFGGGRRICPGLLMAMRTLPLMLGSLILSYDWKLENGVSPESLSMNDKFGLTLQRTEPLKAIPIILC